MLPHDRDPHWLPDPIPASFYARGEAPPWAAWAGTLSGLPPRTLLVAGGVAAAGVLLVGVIAGLAARHPAPAARAGIAQAAASPGGGTGASPPGQPTPLADADTPTPTPSPTPTPTPTRRPTPTPTATPLTLSLQTRHGRVTLTAQTAPRISCTVTVGYSPPPQLAPATTNDSGSVSWTWIVSTQVPPGSYPVQVTCGAATAATTITVGGGQG